MSLVLLVQHFARVRDSRLRWEAKSWHLTTSDVPVPREVASNATSQALLSEVDNPVISVGRPGACASISMRTSARVSRTTTRCWPWSPARTRLRVPGCGQNLALRHGCLDRPPMPLVRGLLARTCPQGPVETVWRTCRACGRPGDFCAQLGLAENTSRNLENCPCAQPAGDVEISSPQPARVAGDRMKTSGSAWWGDPSEVVR
jgi:hypothetical protein